MKKSLIIIPIVALLFLVSWKNSPRILGFVFLDKAITHKLEPNKNELQDGDLIFQSSQSSLSRAIQLATHSKYSHVGMIYKTSKGLFVYEAVQPIKMTPINEWINRGDGKHYVVKRLIDSDKLLNEKTIKQLKANGEKYLGKNYDGYFEWSDERIYCSELVWKMYKQTFDIEIGKLQSLQDFDLSSDLVKQQMTQRYGQNIPLNEKVISPEAMFQSKLLKVVKEG